MKRETKFEITNRPKSGEGSLWEVLAFGIAFILIFTLLARTAKAATLTRITLVAANAADPNMKVSAGTRAYGQTLAANSPTAIPDDDMTITPVHMQSAPSAIPSSALPDSNVAAGIPSKESSKRIVWSSKFVVDTSRSLSPDEDVSYSGEYLLQTGFTDQKTGLTTTLKVGYDREYSYELADGTDGDFTDPGLSITKTWTEGKDFRSPVFDAIILGLSGSGGASHEAARRTYVAGVGPSIGVTKQIHRLSLGQRFGYQRKFFNYDIRDDGTVNSPDVFSSTTDISYNLTEKLALSAETILYYGINFQRTGETTEWTSFSLDWQISKLLATSVGIATKRGTISDDGTSNSVKFYDGSVAQGFFDLVLNF